MTQADPAHPPHTIITPALDAARVAEIAANLDLRALPEDFYANPYPVYAWLRAHDPVKTMPDGSVLLTRYADVVAVYRDAATFSSDKRVEFEPKFEAASPLYAHHTTSLVFNDPPAHTRVRRLIMGALTRRAIDELEPGLIGLVDGLLDGLAARGGGDLIEDFAAAIPVEIIGNLLGVPHADRAPLRAWSLAILGALEPRITTAQAALGNHSVQAFASYLQSLVAERRRHPGDPQHDVLTRLIQGEASGEGADAVDGTTAHAHTHAPRGQLSEAELLHNCIFILNAGHETTTNLIGNALVALQEWPNEQSRLLSKIEQTIVDPPGHSDVLTLAVDEFLRFESSNQLGNRRATRDCVVGGLALPAGTLLTLCIGAANRDSAQFERPEQLDLSRAANRHLAFGFGIHQCAGLSLARLEGRIAIGRFLQRFPRYRLTEPPTRGGRARFRGFLKAPFAAGG
jgi:cytochrome P450